MKRCAGCKAFRGYLSGHDDPCLAAKTCVSEGRFAELAREDAGCRISYEQLRAFAQSAQLGFVATESRVRARHYPPVTDGDVLVALVRDIHRDVFGGTGLRFAGQFRAPGEPDVIVDSLSLNHKFIGAPPDQIHRLVNDLQVLFQVGHDRTDYDAVAHRGARLLEGLFRIHPFHDGNGRTGRLLLLHMFLQLSDAHVGLFPKHGKARRRYLTALRYAHRRRSFLRPESAHCFQPQRAAEPSTPLAKFLRPLLISPHLITEGPPSWIPEPVAT